MKNYFLINAFFAFLLIIGCKNSTEPDTTPPGITIVTPSNNAVISEIVTIRALAVDDQKVTEVSFQIDGIPLANSTDSTEPYEFALNTIAYENGSSHVLTAIATDIANNVTISSPINVVIDNSHAVPSKIEILAIEFQNSSFLIKWQSSPDEDFGSYKLFESFSSNMNDEIEIFQSSNRDDTTYVVPNVGVNEIRYYRLTVRDTVGLETSSQIRSRNSFTYALEFDGIDDYVEISDDNDYLDTGTSFTVEVWFMPETITDLNQIVQYGLDDIDGKQIGITIQNGMLRGGVRGEIPGFDDALGSTILTSNQWYHAAFTYDGEQARIYLNGILEDVVGTNVNMDANSTVFLGIFRNPRTGLFVAPFDGLIDEVRIWNTVRTVQEIQTDMNQSLEGTEEGLIAYWKIEQGEGQIVTDFLGNINGHLGSTLGEDGNDPSWVTTTFPHGN